MDFSKRVSFLIILIFHFFNGLSQSEEVLKVNKLIDFGDSLLYINIDSSKVYSSKALKLAKELKNDSLISSSLDLASKAERRLGNYSKAIELLLAALKIDKKNDFKKGESVRYINLGVIYYYMDDLDKTIYYFKKSLEIDKSLNDSSNLSISYNNIGAVYEALSQFDSALYYFEKGLAINQTLNDSSELSAGYTNTGNIYFRKGEESPEMYIVALTYYEKALNINNESNNNLNDKIAVLEMLALCNKNLGRLDEAHLYIKEAQKIADNSDNLTWKSDVFQNLAQVFNSFEKYDSAYFYLLKYISIKDSLFSEEKSKQITEMEAKYENVEKQKQLTIQQLELDKNEAELDKHRFLEYGLAIGILMLLALGITVYIRYREKNKANELLTSKNEEIELKNLDIMDSLQYAKRIQHAILPPDKLLTQYLDESFILYTPKDIVSGDFYWMNGDENKLLFAAVDCTGHGVPGAFISIVGYNGLNKMIGELKLSQPGEILTSLNKHVADSLHQQENAEVKDGMDISLCLLDKKKKKLQFAGANNPLYIIRNGELLETKGDKMAIGSYYFRDDKLFTNHEIDLQDGDCIYSFTDGYADQFGGKKGKKFMYRQFKELLTKIAPKPMNEQKEILISTFDNWKGDLEQVDDICIIGVRV